MEPAKGHEGAPTITLGGQDWPIPVLALKQNRIIQPLISRTGGKILNGVALSEITEDDVNDLIGIVHTALTRAHPTLTKADLDEMPITVKELAMALIVVMEQSGLYKPAKEEAKPGEAEGPTSPQTGGESSPVYPDA